MWNLKHGTDLSTEPKQDSDIENTLWGGGEDREFGDDRGKLWRLEGISNEVPLYNTGNYIPSFGMERGGRHYEKKHVYVCLAESLCCKAEIDTTL